MKKYHSKVRKDEIEDDKTIGGMTGRMQKLEKLMSEK